MPSPPGVCASNRPTTVTPLTLPAHTSLLSGTFPAFHGVRDNGSFYVGDEITTLAEVMKARGYRTGGFVGAFVLDRRWGIAQGFDHYFDDFDLSSFEMAAGLDAAQRPGSEVVDHALAWLAETGPTSRSSRGCTSTIRTARTRRQNRIVRAFRRRCGGPTTARSPPTDAQVGPAASTFSPRAAAWTNTVIVVVGDHGESLGEHGEQQHGFFVYDAAVRIPLIVAGPGVPARAVPDQVRIVDVMPTILELAGVAAPPAVQGVSLMPLGARRAAGPSGATARPGIRAITTAGAS